MGVLCAPVCPARWFWDPLPTSSARLAASLARPVASNPSAPKSQGLEPQRQMPEMG